MQDELTIKQKAFADYYIETGNATEAAKRAGYSPRTAYRTGADNLKKPHVAAYIAERQKQIDDERICNIAEIQRIRTSIARGERKDDFGFTPENGDILKACADLEKSLKIKEEQEEIQRQREEALNRGIYHTDLDTIADVFHPAVRDMRKHGEIYKARKAGIILESIFASAGITKYSIEEEVYNTLLDGYLEIQTCREALQMVCFACGALASDSRSDSVKVYKPDRYVKYTVGPDRKFNGNTSVSLDGYVSGVSI